MRDLRETPVDRTNKPEPLESKYETLKIDFEV
jgi:hypothetical protein